MRRQLARGFAANCPTCGKRRINTSKDYSICPDGHGKLMDAVAEPRKKKGTAGESSWERLQRQAARRRNRR